MATRNSRRITGQHSALVSQGPTPFAINEIIVANCEKLICILCMYHVVGRISPPEYQLCPHQNSYLKTVSRQTVRRCLLFGVTVLSKYFPATRWGVNVDSFRRGSPDQTKPNDLTICPPLTPIHHKIPENLCYTAISTPLRSFSLSAECRQQMMTMTVMMTMIMSGSSELEP